MTSNIFYFKKIKEKIEINLKNITKFERLHNLIHTSDTSKFCSPMVLANIFMHFVHKVSCLL